MLHSRSQAHSTNTACHLRRLVDFAEPRPDDVCLDVSGVSGLASAIRPWVGELTSAAEESLPSGSFTLVVAPLGHARGDQVRLVRDLFRVCRGRLVLADLVRTRAGDGDHIERLRDPDRTKMRTFRELLDLVERAGGQTRRMDVFTVERPIDPWLAGARDPDRIRRELTAEIDGGPRTGARPRLIGSELWFTQSWAYLAVEPGRRPGRGRARPRR
ncbi:class I SAM-dependent methyltransferase [Actinoallomurus iriomotensis]|uniref:Uncharacterized protein n=1 Tax=Actinoallomurus iriomotensis TaxID=478107 RepID=A0A9W6VXH2_9ACTN|nr:class I SAM-dependent methyltransferase [Actinoallomurus iriomotensis]GLY83870.1 hypothetical protein Airi02_017990 [Actinoallomurus iriomotensis]